MDSATALQQLLTLQFCASLLTYPASYGQVMKYKLATPMTGLDVGLKREWLIGQQLNTITGEDGELHGMLWTYMPHFLHIAVVACHAMPST